LLHQELIFEFSNMAIKLGVSQKNFKIDLQNKSLIKAFGWDLRTNYENRNWEDFAIFKGFQS